MDSGINTGASDELTRVFVSYAREDAKWLDRDYRFNLVPFLMESLKRQNVVFWFDRDLKPGDEFRRQIGAEIDQSQIALLIVSQAFLNSEFIEQHEMSRIAERARLGQTIIVPVLVEPCDWSEYPVLADRQMVPGSMPLIDYTESDSKWARVKAEILDGFKTQVKRIRAAQALARSQREQEDLAREKARWEADERKRPDAPAPPETEQEELAAGPVAGAVTAEQEPAEEETAAEPEPEDRRQGLAGQVPVWVWAAAVAVFLVAVLAAGWIFSPRASAPSQEASELAAPASQPLATEPEPAKNASLKPSNPKASAGEMLAAAKPPTQKPEILPEQKAAPGEPMPPTQEPSIADVEQQANVLYHQNRWPEARPLFQKACDGGVMEGCFYLGYLYDHGYGVTEDDAQASTWFQKACDGGNMEGCFYLGFLYDLGNGVTKDKAKASALYQKACDGRDTDGCIFLATNYETGVGRSQDFAQARTLFQKACDGGEMVGCFYLAEFYRIGEGVTKDYAQARVWYQKACNGGNEQACTQLKTLP
jgi:hypothetical protein